MSPGPTLPGHKLHTTGPGNTGRGTGHIPTWMSHTLLLLNSSLAATQEARMSYTGSRVRKCVCGTQQIWAAHLLSCKAMTTSGHYALHSTEPHLQSGLPKHLKLKFSSHIKENQHGQIGALLPAMTSRPIPQEPYSPLFAHCTHPLHGLASIDGYPHLCVLVLAGL